MLKSIRPAAVPLVISDPFLNVWSTADNLYDDSTRHWTGERNSLVGIVTIDGTSYRFCGKSDVLANRPNVELDIIPQISLNVSALSTEYIFGCGGVELTVTFTSPILPDDLHMISRPLTYIRYSVRSVDNKPHNVIIYTDITGEWCVNKPKEEVKADKKSFKNAKSAFMGTVTQEILNSVGDDHRINWGYVHLINPFGNVFCGTLANRYHYMHRREFDEKDYSSAQKPLLNRNCPIVACEIDFGEVCNQKQEKYIAIAYDDIKSIEYFGEQVCGYWQKYGMTFDEMVEDAVENANGIFTKAAKFDNKLYSDAVASGGKKYADLLALSYRQAYAAHKLIEDKDENIIFLSKENYSNGCIGTVDVSYPSIPVFLLYTPELVRGMMRPIFKFAASDEWEYDYAPHDVGTYPKANGQVYGKDWDSGKLLHKYQMPVEECGNMLIMAAAVTMTDKNLNFIKENFDILEKWASYLKNNGYDPDNQLCTDDFAGHLAHNCNLSIKAILGIASFGILLRLLGDEQKSAEYINEARELAKKWELEAKTNDRYKLAFDQPDTWSLKYNIIWDKIFGLHLFSEQVAKLETQWYIKNQNKYGIPLDSRSDYTKTDWLVWAASLCDNLADFETLIEPVWRFVSETKSRVPFTDWYFTSSGVQRGFQNRSVIGGVFMKVLIEKMNLEV